MNLGSTNDTTQNNNNEYESNNPYEQELHDVIITQSKNLVQLKSDLEKATDHLNQLQVLREEAKCIYQEATQLLEDIRTFLMPLQGGDIHE